MIILYAVTLWLLLGILLVADWKTRGSTQSMVPALHPLIYTVVVVVCSSVFVALSKHPQTALFFRGLHNASSDLMLFFLFVFIRKYTGYEQTDTPGYSRRKQQLVKLDRVLLALCALDFISLMLNMCFGHAYSCEWTTSASGIQVYTFRNVGIGYYVHLLYAYVLTSFSLVVLAKKIMKTPSFYCYQYVLTFCIMVLAVFGDIMNYFLKLSLDISLYAYVLLGLFFCTYPVYVIPKYLTDRVMAKAADVLSGGIICYDDQQECVYANGTVLKMFPNAANLRELSEEFRVWIECENVRDFASEVVKKVRGTAGGKEYYDIECSRLSDQHGAYLGSFFLLWNRTEDLKKLSRERYLATHDPVTRIFNRQTFYSETEKMLKEHPEETYCMVCSNVKDFKLINELFGMETGNEVLQGFAKTLQNLVHDGAVYGRLESDHFAVCLPKKWFDEEIFLREIEKIGDSINCEAYHMHIYLGVYEINDIHMPVSSMCDYANMAIDSIKGSYQYCTAHYTGSMMETVLYEKNLVSEFDVALEKGQFRMFLQPQLDGEGNMKGAEALVRWIHPERGTIPPGKFISVFEKTGLIYRLDRYIWQLACEKLVEWKKRGLEQYYISVNISPKDFYYLDIYNTFVGLITQYDLNPKNLKLEITETALMTDFDKQMVLIDRLRNYGFQIEIDDFGSGYSSLNMLKDMPVDVLKIDMGFLRQTQHVKRSQIILEAIVLLSKQLEMPVVVEGVETESQLKFLMDLGCEAFQGYYFSKPISVDEFEKKYL
jgi:diguanylate cyclase (GGDEF)-like protein